MNCPDCSIEMKPLFSGEYCPNNCDQKVEAAESPIVYFGALYTCAIQHTIESTGLVCFKNKKGIIDYFRSERARGKELGVDPEINIYMITIDQDQADNLREYAHLDGGYAIYEWLAKELVETRFI